MRRWFRVAGGRGQYVPAVLQGRGCRAPQLHREVPAVANRSVVRIFGAVVACAAALAVALYAASTRASTPNYQSLGAKGGETGMKKSDSQKSEPPSQLIDARIKELGDWRGKMLSRLRSLVRESDPEAVEEWKWGVPVWSHDGLICTGETYKSVVKMTFAKGAQLKDPSGLFNSSLAGNTRRAIDFHEGERINEEALRTLIRAAVSLNKSTARS
jgi:hypothetical protein